MEATSLSIEISSREGARERTARVFVDLPAGNTQPATLAVPQVGTLIAALANLDMLSSGKLFGTKYPDATAAPAASERYERLADDGSVITDPKIPAVVVRDNLLRLEWLVAYATEKRVPHADAVLAATGVRVFGREDWRLPTRSELLSLVDDSRHNPAIDTDLFPGTKPEWHWTSTPWAGSPEFYAWVVDFCDGDAYCSGRDGDGWARAVRSVSAAGQ